MGTFALKAYDGADVLVSFDRQHLVGVSEVAEGSSLRIILPEDLLRELRGDVGIG